MNKVLVYQNSQRKLFDNADSPADCINKAEEFYKKQGTTLNKASSDYAVRIYYVEIDNSNKKDLKATITAIANSGKPQNKDKAVIWNLSGKYQGIKLSLIAIDKKDITYHIWEMVEYLLGKENKNIIDNLEFSLKVKMKGNEYNQKQKLILFFSKRGNWGKLWKYEDARQAMAKEGLAMVGRGIEGERPREFRYDLGYPFITSEQDKNVPDGFFKVDFPFPTMPRNERRMATSQLDKNDWSELLDILKKDTKRLRCFECGLFEEETNKIGQKTKFEKGHLQTHSSGGNVSKENITAICKYCNSEQKNVYSYDSITGKKVYDIIPFLKARDYSEKKNALKYLLKHIKKEDVEKILKEISE